jgi:hypothetical protein
MKPAYLMGCIAILLLVTTAPVLAAGDGDDTGHWGFDIIDLIALCPTVLAILLGIVSFIAYLRDQRKKFLIVTLAFAIFALKGIFIIFGEMIYPVILLQPAFYIISSLLDFLVLLCIFFSITMK